MKYLKIRIIVEKGNEVLQRTRFFFCKIVVSFFFYFLACLAQLNGVIYGEYKGQNRDRIHRWYIYKKENVVEKYEGS